MVRALIVDDRVENRQMLQDILEEHGFEFDTAGCIVEAVQLATTEAYDVILMDLAIPRREFEDEIVFGGLDASQEIRSRLGEATPPILAVTANGMRDIRARVLDAGLCEIIEKGSYFADRIVAALQRFVEVPQPIQHRNVASNTKLDSPPESRLAKPVVPKRPAEADPDRSASTNHRSHESDSRVPATGDSPQPSSNRTGHFKANSPSRPARTQLATSDPESVEELRASTLQHVRQAESAFRRFESEIGEAEVEPTHQKVLLELSDLFSTARDIIESPHHRPKPGETYAHWITNQFASLEYRARKLVDLDRSQFFGRWQEMLGEMHDELRCIFSLVRSPVGQTKESEARTAEPELPNAHPTGDQSADPLHPGTAHDPTPASALGQETPSDVLEPIPSPVVDSSRRMVLIVDDEADARHDLEEKLRRLNYRVISCESPATALMFLESQKFDVCLLDLDMPEMNGLQMIRRIRQSKTSGHASIIVVSGSPEKFAAADAIEQGADDYLEKPADERLLRARIQSCLRQSDAWRIELSKFLPPDVLDRVISNKQLLEEPIPADVSVIVCDIRGFSRVSERIGPVQTIRWISDVMNRLSRIILHRGGTIIDYVGDEIMAMWGAPIASQHHANDACNCALAIQEAAKELSSKWRDLINAELQIGIGINSGLAVVGNTGSKHRIKYGPLGDTVNVASRVQGATKYLRSPVLITQSTASRIESGLCGRRISTVKVQNIKEPVQLYELASEQDKRRREEHLLYEQALKSFEAEELPTALKSLAELLVKCPEDGPAKLLMIRVIQAQLGGSFDPIMTLPGK